MVSKAKGAGYPAQNCQYCHTSKLPKKEDFKPGDMNDRGEWLLTEKDKRKAKDLNVEWLKDYPGGKDLGLGGGGAPDPPAPRGSHGGQ